MFSKLRRWIADTGTVEFCDSCSQVCTPACRAEATLQRTRSQAAYGMPPFIR
jgi:hypothetical protein